MRNDTKIPDVFHIPSAIHYSLAKTLRKRRCFLFRPARPRPFSACKLDKKTMLFLVHLLFTSIYSARNLDSSLRNRRHGRPTKKDKSGRPGVSSNRVFRNFSLVRFFFSGFFEFKTESFFQKFLISDPVKHIQAGGPVGNPLLDFPQIDQQPHG